MDAQSELRMLLALEKMVDILEHMNAAMEEMTTQTELIARRLKN